VRACLIPDPRCLLVTPHSEIRNQGVPPPLLPDPFFAPFSLASPARFRHNSPRRGRFLGTKHLENACFLPRVDRPGARSLTGCERNRSRGESATGRGGNPMGAQHRASLQAQGSAPTPLVCKTNCRQWLVAGCAHALDRIRPLLASGQGRHELPGPLPPAQSDLATEVIKDPYSFDFLTLGPGAAERELERALPHATSRLNSAKAGTEGQRKVPDTNGTAVGFRCCGRRLSHGARREECRSLSCVRVLLRPAGSVSWFWPSSADIFHALLGLPCESKPGRALS
jgi:hypothetical protein